MNQCNNDSVVLISSRPRLQGALGAALGAVVAGLALTGGQAKALTVTVNSQLYDVTTFTGTYADNVSKFTTTDMPWWNLGDSGALAGQFASVVGSSSGLAGNFGWGPFFAYGPRNSPVNSLYAYVPVNPGEVPFSSAFSATQAWTYATATLASSSTAAQSTASVPGPLPILGVAAAFGFSRQLRKRIKSSTNSVPSSSAS
ncbi:MAG: hypothetical protein ACI9IO_002223 [Cyanobium sp.]|jgi:hypothetical protein